MAAILIGNLTLGDAIPGLQDSVGGIGDALQGLKGVVDNAIGLIRNAQTAINGLASQLDGIKNDILAAPVKVLQDAIDAGQNLLNSLANTIALDYLNGIVKNLNDAIDMLQALIPANYLNGLLDAMNAGINSQQGRLNSLLSDVQRMTNVSGLVADQASILGDIANTLTNASNDAIGGLIKFADQVSNFANSGVYVVHYTGQLASMGSEVNAVLDPVVGGSTLITCPILVVKMADLPALNSLKEAFGI